MCVRVCVCAHGSLGMCVLEKGGIREGAVKKKVIWNEGEGETEEIGGNNGEGVCQTHQRISTMFGLERGRKPLGR